MSRALFGYGRLGRGFPRVSGDEPMRAADCVFHHLFSPRERG